MADVRAFRGLRYRPDLAHNLGAVLAPPYDVIDAGEQAALHVRNPHNIIRLELGQEGPDDGPQENRNTTPDCRRYPRRLAAVGRADLRPRRCGGASPPGLRPPAQRRPQSQQ